MYNLYLYSFKKRKNKRRKKVTGCGGNSQWDPPSQVCQLLSLSKYFVSHGVGCIPPKRYGCPSETQRERSPPETVWKLPKCSLQGGTQITVKVISLATDLVNSGLPAHSFGTTLFVFKCFTGKPSPPGIFMCWLPFHLQRKAWTAPHSSPPHSSLPIKGDQAVHPSAF